VKRRILLAVAAAVIALPLAGFLYETTAAGRAARRFPPPGRLIDVGGRRLHLLCIGSGRPIVLFEASGFSNSASSAAVRSGLARRTTVCSYDRAGVGWSDSSPDVMSVGQLADDLRQLQDRALDSPMVIVTSSVGGLVSELFARRYPARVAGLVFLDAGNSEMLAITKTALDRTTMLELKTLCAGVDVAGRVGLVRLYDPFAFRRESSEAADRSSALMYGARPWRALCALVRGAPATFKEFDQAPPLRADVPLTLLSAERFDDLLPARLAPANLQQRGALGTLLRRFKETHQQMARRSSRGSWRLVRGSGHLIASDRPQAVIDATLDVMKQSGR
jgi:pimeloyl-ACP methyl ester carboxylesterase